MLSYRLYLFTALAAFAPLSAAYAERTDAPAGQHALTESDRLSLARQFLSKVKSGFAAADRKLQKADPGDISNIPDGEILFFRFRLDKRFWLDNPVMTRIADGQLLVSVRDAVTALDFPITVSADGYSASGWYIREDNPFEMNAESRTVQTGQGKFNFSEAVIVEEGDVFVPVGELDQWFNFSLSPNVSALEFMLTSPVKLPIQEAMERKGRVFSDRRIGPPVLPLKEDAPKAFGVPFVDVSTSSRYTSEGDGTKPEMKNRASVLTSGDLAYGTLKTTSQYEREEKLTNMRATYSQDSKEADLLGPLNARRFELGDVIPTNIPLNETHTAGMGARITNADPLRGVLRPSTEITGNSIPGWDVELFRENQLLAFQSVDENGLYRFANVDLYTTNNNFKLVFYGPQGEIREEMVEIPVDPKRISEMGGAYDIAIYAQNTQTYRKLETEDKDRGTPNITAYYETPIGDVTAVSAGISTRSDNGNQKGTVYSGLSTSLAGALLNFNTGVDNDGEMAGEIVARKRIGEHDLRNETRVATDLYGYTERDDIETGSDIFFTEDEDGESDGEIFGNQFSVNGPLGIALGKKPRYNLDINYAGYANGDDRLRTGATFSTSFKPLSLSQQISHTTGSAIEEDTIMSQTSVSGRVGKNRVRLLADYEIAPESNLDRVAASLKRNLTPKLEMDLGVQRQMETKLTEGTARLNWDAGFVNISPGLSYNSENDLAATLNTRFGLAQDPSNGKVRMFDRQITSNGAVSAFVFLDKNGNNQFDEGDEPIDGAIVRAPQNGGREITDEEGYAFFRRMRKMQTTDIYVDPDSLADPMWISGYAGASIIPREGHVIPIQFPVHMAGEIDGTTYARGDDPNSATPIKSIRLGLYDLTGKRVMSVVSEMDGFYLLSKIPPGEYFLNVDDAELPKGMARPLPQPVRIGYDGTIVYSNNIYMKEGATDAPIAILSDRKAVFGEREDEFAARSLLLNMGAYKSRVAMGIAWFKAKMFANDLLQEADLLAKPSEIVPDDKGIYRLRLALKNNDLTQAYRRCAMMQKEGVSCTVEILPGGLDQKVAAR